MKSIGIIVENSREYGREMIKGIAAFARQHRDWILRSVSEEEIYSDKLLQYDGIIARIADDRLAKRLASTKLPVVDVFCQKDYGCFAQVDTDHRSIGEMARKFFHSRGFSNLAFCGLPGACFSDEREKTFSDKKTFRYARAKTVPDNAIFYAERAERILDAHQLRKWIKSLPLPVAVFCCNDLRALQLLRVTRSCGLHVPEEVAILGVDDDTILCSFAEVPISSINPNSNKVGYDAARILHAMMLIPPSRKQHRIHLVKPKELLERASTEFMPVDPPWLGQLLIHIERNMNRPISAAEIFKLSGYCKAHVENIFRNKLHTSVQAYITAVKMREAKRLIADPSLRISEIAYRCGFSSPQYFCRTFTATFGVNPKAYRVRN